MKAAKILLAVSVACTLTTTSVMAQGRINFNNSSTTPLVVNDYPYSPVTNVLGTASTAYFGFGPASVEIRLYAGLTSSSLSPVLIGTAANQTFVLNASSLLPTFQGTFNGGNPLPLPGFDGSTPVFLQFWAFNSFYAGASPIIQVTPTLSPAAATSVFSTTADGSHWNGLHLYYIPEPSTLALLGMSFPMMFLARRRR